MRSTRSSDSRTPSPARGVEHDVRTTPKCLALLCLVLLALSPLAAQAISFDILLDPGKGVPPPVLGGATPSGTAQIVVDTSSGQVDIVGTYVGMTSEVVAAHLHGLAPPGETAGPLITLDVTGGSAGSFSGGGVLEPDDLAGLLAGDTYINVHTANPRPGEIRGQVVPEPGTAMLVAIGCAGFGLVRRQA